MIAQALLTWIMLGLIVPGETVEFRSKRYGLKLALPGDWSIVQRERDDRIVVALFAGADPDRPAVFACELALAPASLDEWRTRIDGNARRGGRPGELTRNEIVETPSGPRLETLWEFRPAPDTVWIERSVRLIANRQLYTFLISADGGTYTKSAETFESTVNSVAFSPPETGCTKVDGPTNRWLQSEYRFALDLPLGWQPALAPAEIALMYANAPAVGIWSDNGLVIARPHTGENLERLSRTLPDQLRAEEPGCEVLRCELRAAEGKPATLETLVRTRRGPFSMTVLEWRFAGERFDYEIKFTVESRRFDELEPLLRQSLESFREEPGNVPAVGKPA